MTKYKACAVFSKKTKTLIGYIDIESSTALQSRAEYSIGDITAVADYIQVVTRGVSFNILPNQHEITIEGIGTFTVTGVSKTKMNAGKWKDRFNYLLTLEG